MANTVDLKLSLRRSIEQLEDTDNWRSRSFRRLGKLRMERTERIWSFRSGRSWQWLGTMG